MAKMEEYKGLDDRQQKVRQDLAREAMICAAGGVADSVVEAVADEDGVGPAPSAEAEQFDETGLVLPIMEELDGHLQPSLYD